MTGRVIVADRCVTAKMSDHETADTLPELMGVLWIRQRLLDENYDQSQSHEQYLQMRGESMEEREEREGIERRVGKRREKGREESKRGKRDGGKRKKKEGERARREREELRVSQI